MMIYTNISVISWKSVLLVKETGVPGENHWPAASDWQTFSHKVHLTMIGNQTHDFSGDMLWLHM
jgi:hypothetical protein